MQLDKNDCNFCLLNKGQNTADCLANAVRFLANLTPSLLDLSMNIVHNIIVIGKYTGYLCVKSRSKKRSRV